jgi:hypothetical protein
VLAPILAEIEGMDLLTLTQKDIKLFINYLDEQMASTLVKLDKEVEELIPLLIQAGIASYLFGMGADYSPAILNELMKRRIHQYTVDKIILNLQNSHRGIFRNIHGKTDDAMRGVLGRVMRLKYASGIIPPAELKKLQNDFKGLIKDAVASGYVDKAGRQWKAETYSKVVANTAVMTALNESIINEGIANGYQYGIIVGPAAVDACNKWRGKTIKLDASAPGTMISYDDLKATNECFHANCRHSVRVITDEEKTSIN